MIGSIGRLSGYCRNAWLDSGYIFCASAWLLNVISHIFYVEVDSNPEVFFLHSLAECRSMLSRCFSFFGSHHDDLDAHKVSIGLCARKGFRGGPFLDISGTLQLLNSDHVRERDKALLRGVFVGEYGMVFC